MPHALIILLLLGGPAVALGAPAPYEPDPMVLEVYEEQWGPTVRTARTGGERAIIARQLLQAADTTSIKPMRMLLWHKAYEVGKVDRLGYQQAADALDHIQKHDPHQRVWALERLAELIHTVYRAAPHKLQRGLRYFEVRHEIAVQRVELLEAQLDTDRLATVEATAATRLANQSLARGITALQQCIARAERDARRVDSMQARELRAFIDQHTPTLEAAKRLRTQLEAKQKFWSQLVVTERLFDANPTAQSAQKLAMAYIVAFDRPERIAEPVREQLDESVKAVAANACLPVGELSADGAATIGRWYADRAAETIDIDSKKPLLIRARAYLEHAKAAGNADADATLTKVSMLLTASGVDNKQQERLVAALTARLDYQFGPQPQPTDGGDEPLATAVDEDGGDDDAPEVTIRPRPTPPPDTVADRDDAGGDPMGDVEAATPAGTRHGRPMTTCVTCGRQFFAGWQVKADKCPRCSGGRPNIFDLGN